MVPSPLSCHFLGSPLDKTALLTEGCQKNTAKLLRPSAVNRSHCWAEGHAKTTLKRGVCTETGTVVNFLFADWYDPLRSETPVQCIYSLDVNTAKNARSSREVHLPGCFNAPHFLLTRVPSSTPFPNSLAYIHITPVAFLCIDWVG